MTTENSPAQKSFDISKYKVNATDREVVDVEVGEDKFKVEIKPLTWFRKNQLVTQCMTFTSGGETKFDGSKYVKEVLKEIVTDAPWGKTTDAFLQSINSELGQALESIVPKAFLNQELDVDAIKKG
tara:strand:+ start:3724 stop:4101 length:378 start_codon:yes stop_codon:yes gene_type:complete